MRPRPGWSPASRPGWGLPQAAPRPRTIPQARARRHAPRRARGRRLREAELLQQQLLLVHERQLLLLRRELHVARARTALAYASPRLSTHLSVCVKCSKARHVCQARPGGDVQAPRARQRVCQVFALAHQSWKHRPCRAAGAPARQS